jgi:metacaspase-1
MIEFSTVLPIVIVAAVAAAAYFFLKKKKSNNNEATGDVSSFTPDPAPVADNPTVEEGANMKKFALIVGINHYKLPGNDLSGCINDANNVRNYLMNCAGFNPSNIKMVTDSNATKANILSGLRWLIAQGAEGVELFYYHSGHGTQVFDASGDESDQLDEVLVTHDFDWNNSATILLDDYLAEVFAGLPQGAFLSMICDTCHSGSMTKDLVRNIAMPKDMAKKMEGRAVKRNKFGMKNDGSQRHILLSGCRDDQTSSEAVIGGVRQGALTYNFIKTAKASTKSWRETHADVIKNMKNSGWSQEPVLSGMDTLKDRVIFGQPAGKSC